MPVNRSSLRTLGSRPRSKITRLVTPISGKEVTCGIVEGHSNDAYKDLASSRLLAALALSTLAFSAPTHLACETANLQPQFALPERILLGSG